jgi:glycosyltransferase involved in cell wall biosynthesis
MRAQLSIAFATFNSENYLNEFYESIFNQKIDNIEIIVVDDGSTDSSYHISLAWAKKHRNIKVIKQENSGLSVARNLGISFSSGEYLVLPDPDDIMYPNLFKTLIEMIKEHQLDVAVINGLHIFENKNPKPIFNSKIPSNKIMAGEEFLKAGLKSGSFLHTTWLNIYKLNFIQEANIHFIPKLLHQDILWTTEVLFLAKRVMYSDQKLYGYTHRNGSATRQENSDEKNIKSIKNYSKILQYLDSFNKKNMGKFKYPNVFRSQIPNEFTNIKRSLNRIQDLKKLNEIIEYLNTNKIFDLVLKNTTSLLQHLRIILTIAGYKKHLVNRSDKIMADMNRRRK